MTLVIPLCKGCDIMKIEKVNENQIRCTLTKDDLADRELKISELAYGTEKAKSLFRDMMQQAAYEFGFEAEDIPLMIEAIPLSADCIILIITKVEDPEELDTRFSKFAPSLNDEDTEDHNTEVPQFEGADDVLGLFRKIHEEKMKTEAKRKDNFIPLPDAISNSKQENTSVKSKKEASTVDLTKIYTFQALDDITRLAVVLKGYYTGNNSLYKNHSNGKYFLTISKSSHTPEEFNRICNILSEYGTQVKHTTASEAFLHEHNDLYIKEAALQKLALL